MSVATVSDWQTLVELRQLCRDGGTAEVARSVTEALARTVFTPRAVAVAVFVSLPPAPGAALARSVRVVDLPAPSFAIDQHHRPPLRWARGLALTNSSPVGTESHTATWWIVTVVGLLTVRR
jgi:hypothetical protein